MSIWRKIWDLVNPDYLTFEKDYLLLHEILQVLRSIGTTMTATGSDSSGFDPIYEFQIETATLHFGTLAGLLNNPEDFKKPEGVTLGYWQEYKAKRHEVREVKYKWQEIADAIETLKARNEIEKTEITPYNENFTKIIHLTKNGLASLNTKKYLKQHQEERDKKIAYRSTISTNFWMKWFTGIMAIASVMTLTVQVLTCNKKPILELPKEIGTQEHQKYLKCSTATVAPPEVYKIDTPPPLKTKQLDDKTLDKPLPILDKAKN